MNKRLVVIIMVLLVAFVSGAIYFKTAIQHSNYRATIKVALKDPGSAEFRDEQVSSSGTYCAEVNSKNSYGGYIGFERVMSDGKGYVFFERDGVHGEGGEATINLAKIENAALDIRIKVKEREIRGESIDIPSDYKIREVALRYVFEKRWSENCSKSGSPTIKDYERTAFLKAHEASGQTQEEPSAPMPANAEPDKYARQGWSCKPHFVPVNNRCEKQPK